MDKGILRMAERDRGKGREKRERVIERERNIGKKYQERGWEKI